MRKAYSFAYKAKLVKRMQGSNSISANQLSKETGVSQQTLSRWLQEADSIPFMANRNRNSRKWSVEDKARIVNEAAALSDDKLGAYLRREGVHPLSTRSQHAFPSTRSSTRSQHAFPSTRSRPNGSSPSTRSPARVPALMDLPKIKT